MISFSYFFLVALSRGDGSDLINGRSVSRESLNLHSILYRSKMSYQNDFPRIL